MPHIIKQIINDSRMVQTGLAVYVDDIRVDYTPLYNFGYEFTVEIGNGNTVKEADEAIEAVVGAMISQSYDHGSRWCRVKKETSTEYLDHYGIYKATVYFRIRDCY